MKRLFTSTARLILAWVCAVTHLAALVAALLVLGNGMPPGEIASRRQFIATHALEWGAGWFLWALAALTLVLFYLAWTDSLPRRPWAVAGVGLASLGALVDWAAQAVSVVLAPDWAGRAASDNSYLNLFSVWDRAFMVLSPGLANLLYTLGGVVLIAASFSTHEFPRLLAWWGLATWFFGFALALAAFAGEYAWIAPTSAGLFGLFVPWMLLIAYRWLALDHE